MFPQGVENMKEQVLAVQRMQEYIEKDRTEEISLSDLARASLFSSWYAYRLFRNCLGLAPSEYIRKYRLTITIAKRTCFAAVAASQVRFAISAPFALQRSLTAFSPARSGFFKNQIEMEK